MKNPDGLRKVFNYWKESLILASKHRSIQYNPFDEIDRPVFRDYKKQAVLSSSEVKRIENLDFENNKRLDKVKDLFLFQSYTGLGYVDMQKTLFTSEKI